MMWGMRAASTRIPANPDLRPSTELFKAYVEFMKLMLGNLFIINAGSATALMTLYGAMKQPPAPLAGTAPSLISFAGTHAAIIALGVGAFSAVLATALIAWQENINSDRRESGEVIRADVGIFGFLLMVLSGAAFLVACLLAVLC